MPDARDHAEDGELGELGKLGKGGKLGKLGGCLGRDSFPAVNDHWLMVCPGTGQRPRGLQLIRRR